MLRGYYDKDKRYWIELPDKLISHHINPPDRYKGFHGDIWMKDDLNFWVWHDLSKKWIQGAKNGKEIKYSNDIRLKNEL